MASLSRSPPGSKHRLVAKAVGVARAGQREEVVLKAGVVVAAAAVGAQKGRKAVGVVPAVSSEMQQTGIPLHHSHKPKSRSIFRIADADREERI